MHDQCCSDFQQTVDKYLIRHRSIIDVMTKYQEATSRVNRSVAKAVTECGCIQVNAQKQHIPPQANYSDLTQYMTSHISGDLCPSCKEVITKELGHSLFYLTALCSLTGLKLDEVIKKECKDVSTLGVFHLS